MLVLPSAVSRYGGMCLMPFGEIPVLPKYELECVGNDVVTAAFDEPSIAVQCAEKLGVQFDRDLLTDLLWLPWNE